MPCARWFHENDCSGSSGRGAGAVESRPHKCRNFQLLCADAAEMYPAAVLNIPALSAHDTNISIYLDGVGMRSSKPRRALRTTQLIGRVSVTSKPC